MQNYIEHGISIGIKRTKDNFFIKLKINGKLTHEDYEMMMPMIDNAIKGIEQPQIKLLVDAIDFDGWDAHAIWDDLKFSFGHIDLFEKIAFVGNKKWEKYAIKISNWFMIGDVEFFDNINDAIDWIDKEEPS